MVVGHLGEGHVVGDVGGPTTKSLTSDLPGLACSRSSSSDHWMWGEMEWAKEAENDMSLCDDMTN
jgi:hypothetical protein